MQSSKLIQLKQTKAKFDREYEVPVDVEKFLKMVQTENVKYRNEKLNIDEKEFITLCRMGRNVLLKQPSLLRLNGPIFIATGTVGYYKDLMNIVSRCGHPAMYNYLFLGDYIGRGDKNIECLVYLICCKIKMMDNFFMLRGCLDSIAMARSYNFYDECLDRFSPKAWAEACQFLCSLPFAAVVENQIFCCHGGLSPSLRSVEQINKIPRPLETPQSGLACDLVWADPSYKEDSLMWSKNERGLSYTFNKNAVEQFRTQNKLSMICRGHEVIYDGFYMNKQKTIASICSLADYGGLYSNSAAVYVLNAQFQAYFKVIKQREHFPMETNFIESSSSQLNKKIIEKQKQRKRLERERIQQIQMEEQKRKTEEEIEQSQRKESSKQLGELAHIKQEPPQDFEQEQIQEKQEEDEMEDEVDKMKALMGTGNFEIVHMKNSNERSEDSGQEINDFQRF